MGNSPPQALFEGGQEEKQLGEHLAASATDMLEAYAVVAGTLLLALGAWYLLSFFWSSAWYLLSHLSSGDAPDSADEEIKGKGLRTDGRVKSDCSGHYLQSERFHLSSSKLYTSDTYLRSDQNVIKILSYNVWSGDVKLQERMKAIGNEIQKHSPDLICFQEVTPEIYEIFESSKWWVAYKCSVSPEKASERDYFCMQLSRLPAKFFHERIGSNKERELCIAGVDTGMAKKLFFASSHLVSPNPDHRHPDRMHSTERVLQAKEALENLKNCPNVVFGGDMNWDEEVDGPIHDLLPHGWQDAWEKLRPGEDGWTFDTKANKMLSCHQPLQKRLDRFLCHLTGFSISSIEMIGREAIPGLYYRKEKKVWKVVKETAVVVLPVLPSDHFGLLLTIDARVKS